MVIVAELTVNDDLLWWNLVFRCPHINLLVDVNTGDDEEKAGTLGSPHEQPSQPEYDDSLVLLDYPH